MKVTFLGQLHYFNCCIPERLEGCEIEKINYDPERRRDWLQHDTDAWILFRPDFLYTVEELRAMRGKKIWISTEPVERKNVMQLYKRMMSGFKNFTLITHYDRTHLSLLKKSGIDAVEFPLPVNLVQYHSWRTLPEYDFFFSGRSTPHREDLMTRLKRKYRFFHAAHGLIDDRYVRAVNESSVALNLNIEGWPQLQHRLQNMLACGAFVMSERQTHDGLLKPGVHYVEFKGKADLEEKAEYYLNHADERCRIAQCGMEFAKQNFNAETEWQKIIQMVM